MRKFVVNVNGNRYEVEVEEVPTGVQPATPVIYSATPVARPQEAPTPKPAAASAPAPAPTPAPAPKTEPSGQMGSVKITAPMPGIILDIRVKQGESVSKGAVIAILEAMKMENEILSPQDAVISSINVSKGQQVNSGDIIMTLS
jgi:biotin carboxyl carrier protein